MNTRISKVLTRKRFETFSMPRMTLALSRAAMPFESSQALRAELGGWREHSGNGIPLGKIPAQIPLMKRLVDSVWGMRTILSTSVSGLDGMSNLGIFRANGIDWEAIMGSGLAPQQT